MRNIFLALALSFAAIGLVVGCDGSKIPNQESTSPDTIATGKDGSTVPDGSTLPEEAPTSTEKAGQEKTQTTPERASPEPSPEKTDAGGLGIKRQALSGARLKIQYIEGDDGSKQFLSLYDTMLNIPCFWREASSFDSSFTGRRYCVSQDLNVPALHSGDFYEDASCTAPIFRVPLCSNPIPFYGVVYKSNTSTCTSQRECHGLAPFTGNTLYQKAGETCTKSPNLQELLKTNLFYRSSGRCSEQSLLGKYVSGEVKIEP